MGPHREGTGTIVGREAILKVLESYDPSAIRIATIGSHSALDVCDGAVEEGLPTLVVCEKGRASPYTRYFHAMRDKEGRAVRGMVDEAIVLSKFQDVLSEKMQDRLRKANVVFIPNRSFTSYCDLDGIERSFRVPLFGSRNLLRTEEREEERSYYWILEKAGLPAPEKIEDPKDIDGLVIVKLHHKVKKLERGFFTAASYKEYRAKSASATSSVRSSTSISSTPPSRSRERSSNSLASTGASRHRWTAMCACRRTSNLRWTRPSAFRNTSSWDTTARPSASRA